MLGLDPSISGKEISGKGFSGLRYAPPENDGRASQARSFRSIHLISGSSGSTQASPSAI